MANRWGKENGYPLFEKYPQYKEVREIGEKLSDMGGIELMREAQRIANERIPCPGMTEFWWHRIGDWLA
ncbi:MAG: hypothetical protein HZC52_09920 [Planctomycetes bacterium]|nr:hypothetical protein [Planctomycetota bacterium]